MTIDDVKKAVAEVKRLAGDPEAAHGREDALFSQLLTSVASGKCEDPKACAVEAIKTLRLDFARWCA